MTPTSIYSRKRDLLYLLFFIIHIPTILLVDITPFYPISLKPTFITTLREWYIETYKDRFFRDPPAWFRAYLWMELGYHLPVSVWSVGALLREDPKLPLHLLLFAAQAGMTTLTCIADYLSWTDMSVEEKGRLSLLYVPYLALAVFMGVDMFGRLERRLDEGGNGVGGKKGL